MSKISNVLESECEKAFWIDISLISARK